MNNQTQKFYISRVLLIFSGILFGFLTTTAVSANNDVSTNRNPVADFDGDFEKALLKMGIVIKSVV